MSTVYEYIQTRSSYFIQENKVKIIFDTDFITDNVITMDISGTNIGNINFTTDHDTTVGLIVTAIDNLGGINAGLSPTDSSNHTIEVYGLTNTLVTITNVSITGGVSQTGYTIIDSRLSELVAQATSEIGCVFEAKGLTNKAIALTVMHWLALESNSGGSGNASNSGSIKSKKEGDLMISYGSLFSSSSGGAEIDPYLAMTGYGVELWGLWRSCIFRPRNRMSTIC